MNEAAKENLQTVKRQLKEEFNKAGPEWQGAEDRIWCFGPRRCGPNVLLNNVPGYCRPSVWQAIESQDSKTVCKLAELDNSVVTGFQMATLAGPLCEEPLHGVCFIVEDWWYGGKTRPANQQAQSSASAGTDITTSKSLANSTCDKEITQSNSESNEVLDSKSEREGKDSSEDSSGSALNRSPLPPGLIVPASIDWTSSVFGPLSGQLISTMKEGCRRAFQARPQRLVVAMYKCNIQATMDVLGKETDAPKYSSYDKSK